MKALAVPCVYYTNDATHCLCVPTRCVRTYTDMNGIWRACATSMWLIYVTHNFFFHFSKFIQKIGSAHCACLAAYMSFK